MYKLTTFIISIIVFGCQSKKELPILSYTIDDSGNQAYYGINYDYFTNQLGQKFTSSQTYDKVYIANFFFTRCPSICPPMRKALIDIAETFKNDADFLIISHTIDPQHDTVEVLKNYANTTNVPFEKWQFLRSSLSETKEQAVKFMTNFKPAKEGVDFYHSSYVALVDTDKFIRGFYNVLIPEEVERLKKDIKTLLD